MRAARGYWVGLAVFYAGILALVGAFALVAGAGIDEAQRPAIRGPIRRSSRRRHRTCQRPLHPMPSCCSERATISGRGRWRTDLLRRGR